MTDSLTLTFLGTGASIPTPTRGVSSCYLQKGSTGFLFDCGEGTQLKLQQAGIALVKIRYILISHLHGDHLFGLPGLLSTMQLLNRDLPLTLFGPVGLGDYLSCLQQSRKFTLDYPLEIVELKPE